MPFLELNNNMIGLVADDKPLGEPKAGIVRMRLGSDGALRTRVNGGEEVPVGGGEQSSLPKMVIYNITDPGGGNPFTFTILENTTGLGTPTLTWNMFGVTDITFSDPITTGLNTALIRAWTNSITSAVVVAAHRNDSYTIRLSVTDIIGEIATPKEVCVEFTIYPG